MVDVQNEENDFDSDKDFICERCVETIKGIVKPAEESTFYEASEEFLLLKGQTICQWWK